MSWRNCSRSVFDFSCLDQYSQSSLVRLHFSAYIVGPAVTQYSDQNVGWTTEQSWFDSPCDQQVFLHSQFVRTSSGTHPSFCLVGMELFTLTAHHSLPAGIGVKENIEPSLIYRIFCYRVHKKNLPFILVAELHGTL